MAVDLKRAIEEFSAAHQRGESVLPAGYESNMDFDEAYRVMLGVIERRVSTGERQIGWKVGLTAKAIQEQLGYHEPVFGCVVDRVPSGHIFGPSELNRASIETELCICLKSDLGGRATADDVLASIDTVAPSFEIIETRCDVLRNFALALADNAQQRCVVVDKAIPFGRDMALEDIEARIVLNGREVEVGRGSAVLGNPVNSIVWLAAALGRYGRQLRAGDIVMTGSFVRQVPFNRGDRAVAHFSGIGSVSVGMT